MAPILFSLFHGAYPLFCLSAAPLIAAVLVRILAIAAAKLIIAYTLPGRAADSHQGAARSAAAVALVVAVVAVLLIFIITHVHWARRAFDCHQAVPRLGICCLFRLLRSRVPLVRFLPRRLPPVVIRVLPSPTPWAPILFTLF